MIFFDCVQKAILAWIDRLKPDETKTTKLNNLFDEWNVELEIPGKNAVQIQINAWECKEERQTSGQRRNIEFGHSQMKELDLSHQKDGR